VPDIAALQLANLSCGYRGIPVLRDVDLEVRPGEILAVLGPNGAGKSTMVKTIMGVLPALAGSVSVDGRAVTRWPSWRRFQAGIVWVPEGRRLFSDMTVADNVQVAGRAGRPGNTDLAQLFPVLDRAARRPSGSLSGGEQQMVALARALAAGPRVLLLDEPSLGLAPKVVDEIMHTVAHLRYLRCAVVLVEQNVELALDVADRVVALEDGRARDLGRADGLLDDADLRRRFLGVR
jgi:branched-chain amino acid transport system ATP-binding protein